MARHSQPFEARHSGGRCGICDGDIIEGDDVCFCDDEITHTECADDL